MVVDSLCFRSSYSLLSSAVKYPRGSALPSPSKAVHQREDPPLLAFQKAIPSEDMVLMPSPTPSLEPLRPPWLLLGGWPRVRTLRLTCSRAEPFKDMTSHVIAIVWRMRSFLQPPASPQVQQAPLEAVLSSVWLPLPPFDIYIRPLMLSTDRRPRRICTGTGTSHSGTWSPSLLLTGVY